MSVPPPPISDEEAERHTIYSMALMAITFHYWNGAKYGRDRQYPLNPPISTSQPGKLRDDYVGHNIAALIVDGEGLIIDFDFNHNDLFNSSVEHAESRLLRRTFSLTQIQDTWDVRQDAPVRNYSSLLTHATLYTTLESCAQCSGIMTLAQLKQVIYLQTDPGQYSVGNIMWNLTEVNPPRAPRPIPASAIKFKAQERLDAAYADFKSRPKEDKYAMTLDTAGNVIPEESYTKSITSFLCTKAAYDIYADAKADFDAFKPAFPSWKPEANNPKQLTNEGVLAEARQFVRYATSVARRGTPHRA